MMVQDAEKKIKQAILGQTGHHQWIETTATAEHCRLLLVKLIF